MKTTISLTLLLIGFLSINQISAFSQSLNLIPEKETLGVNKIDAITDAGLRDAAMDVIRKYESTANFWDKDIVTFDDKKYANFMGLFSGKAQVINDLSKNLESVSYFTYASTVFDKLQITGVPFELSNIEIKEIELDDSGFYSVKVDAVKTIYLRINKKGKIVNIPRGIKIPIQIELDMPEYMISNVRITSIEKSKKKKWLDLKNIFSLLKK